jgi:hypothetical protein
MIPMDPHGGPAVPLTREQEGELLKGQAEYFEGALEEIKKRLADLEAKQKEK